MRLAMPQRQPSIAETKKSPANWRGSCSNVVRLAGYLDPAPEVVLWPEPIVEPGGEAAPGTEVPEPESQSFIAVVEPVPEVVLPVLPREFALCEAELPGPQSLSFDKLPEVPLIEPLGLVVLGLVVLGLVVLVCAMAAVPRVSATIEAAVRTRRFIGISSLQYA